MQKRVSTLVGIIIIVIVAVVLFGGVFAYQYFAPKEFKTITPVFSIPATKIGTHASKAEITTDPVTGWKIYKNDDFGFQFEYPAGATTNDNSTFEQVDLKINLSPDYWFQVEVAPSGGAVGNLVFPDSAFDDKTSSNVTIGNTTFIKGKIGTAFVGMESGAVVYLYGVTVNGAAYTLYAGIHYNRWSGPGASYQDIDNSQIFNKIFSTFKFTNDETSNWKTNIHTYTDNALGVEFEYPKDFILEKVNQQIILNVPSSYYPGNDAQDVKINIGAGMSDIKGFNNTNDWCQSSNQAFGVQESTSNGINFMVGVSGEVPIDGWYSTAYTTLYNGSCYEIILSVKTQNSDVAYGEPFKSILEQIVSSFKFTK